MNFAFDWVNNRLPIANLHLQRFKRRSVNNVSILIVVFKLCKYKLCDISDKNPQNILVTQHSYASHSLQSLSKVCPCLKCLNGRKLTYGMSWQLLHTQDFIIDSALHLSTQITYVNLSDLPWIYVPIWNMRKKDCYSVSHTKCYHKIGSLFKIYIWGDTVKG